MECLLYDISLLIGRNIARETVVYNIITRLIKLNAHFVNVCVHVHVLVSVCLWEPMCLRGFTGRLSRHSLARYDGSLP